MTTWKTNNFFYGLIRSYVNVYTQYCISIDHYNKNHLFDIRHKHKISFKSNTALGKFLN